MESLEKVFFAASHGVSGQYIGSQRKLLELSVSPVSAEDAIQSNLHVAFSLPS